MFRKTAFALAALAAAAAAAAAAAPSWAQSSMSNEDVIALVQADMSEDIILAAIRGADGGFDTSAAGLLSLKNAGVPDSIISAMVTSASPAAATSSAEASGGGFNPETVSASDASGTHTMRYLTPNIRTASRGFGFGGVAQYATLAGTSAQLRMDAEPSFVIAVPDNAQVQSYFTLASFAVRSNGTREVLIAGGSGFGGFSTGIHPDRIVPVTTQLAANQSSAPAGFSLYEIEPVSPLASGEYAVVISAGLAASAGIFAGYNGADSFYDFGVD